MRWSTDASRETRSELTTRSSSLSAVHQLIASRPASHTRTATCGSVCRRHEDCCGRGMTEPTLRLARRSLTSSGACARWRSKWLDDILSARSCRPSPPFRPIRSLGSEPSPSMPSNGSHLHGLDDRARFRIEAALPQVESERHSALPRAPSWGGRGSLTIRCRSAQDGGMLVASAANGQWAYPRPTKAFSGGAW